MSTSRLPGYLRAAGRKGIRNVVAVTCLVECVHPVLEAGREVFDATVAEPAGAALEFEALGHQDSS